MKKEYLIYIITGLLVLAGIIFAIIYKNKPIVLSNNLTLFVKDGCPHCTNVEKFITDNKVNDKVLVEQKNIGSSQNIKEMIAYSQKCGLDTNNLGTPLLWTGTEGKCIVGDVDIISYLTEKTK